jgi:hypothetical protein
MEQSLTTIFREIILQNQRPDMSMVEAKRSTLAQCAGPGITQSKAVA